MKLPSQDHIDEGVFAAIGLAITTASAAHYAMAIQLLRVVAPAGGDQIMDPTIITFGMKVDTLLGLLKTLIRIKKPDIADEFDAAADKLRACFSNKRDVLAHSAWRPTKKQDRIKVTKIKTVGSFAWSEHKLTETEIRIWASDIHAAASRIDDLLTSAGFPTDYGSTP